MSIYHHFSPSIISTKPYVYSICRKKLKSTSGLTKYLNTSKSHLCAKFQLPQKPLWNKSYNKKDVLRGNWDNKGDLFGKTVITTTVNGTFETLTEDTPWKRLFASKSLLALRDEWLSSYKFSTGTPISDKEYKHPKFKHKNSFYPFNNQLDYSLAQYFAKLETTKNNINEILTDLLMAPLTKKLSYKNVNK